jgi:hypothetical protein
MRSVSDAALSRELQASYIGSSDDLNGAVIQTDAELRALVRDAEALSDDRPTLQYPHEDVRGGTFFTSFFAPDPARALVLLPDDNAALRERVQRTAAATERALASIPLRELSPPEVRELALGRSLAHTLRENPDDQGLWSLLSVDLDRARLAERALQRPGAAALLVKPLAELAAAERAHFFVLQDAAFVLARRAFYRGDYGRARELLERVQLEPSEQARRWLLLASSLRALQQHDASASAFASAAAASGDAGFRATCTKLAAQASFDPDCPSCSIQ